MSGGILLQGLKRFVGLFLVAVLLAGGLMAHAPASANPERHEEAGFSLLQGQSCSEVGDVCPPEPDHRSSTADCSVASCSAPMPKPLATRMYPLPSGRSVFRLWDDSRRGWLAERLERPPRGLVGEAA
ncbi:hypothetical protein ACETRX_12445 [Labrys portucalensis]|uniref:DUF2946 domain-containing protein n=1 Tax=Labrys neptuniae TaxID=376174 RepID=A0ABV6ZE08_9HYPH